MECLSFYQCWAEEVGAKYIGCPVTISEGESLRVSKEVDLNVEELTVMLLSKIFGGPLQILSIES